MTLINIVLVYFDILVLTIFKIVSFYFKLQGFVSYPIPSVTMSVGSVPPQPSPLQVPNDTELDVKVKKGEQH